MQSARRLGSAIPAAERPLVERLRHPAERGALAFAIVANLVLIAFSVAVVAHGAPWIESIPFVRERFGWFRAIAIAALLALPALHLGRHVRLYAARGDGVRVGETQFPELLRAIERVSARLGVEPVPHLYVSKSLEESSSAHSIAGGLTVVLLSANLFKGDWRRDIEALSFLLARAVGSLALGHTRWWVELFTLYTRSVPALRVPLLMAWTLSRDRCAAHAVPGGIRGLLHEGVGKHLSTEVDLGAFSAQAERSKGFWRLLAGLWREEPLLTSRARALFDAGFFARPGAHPTGREPR